ncbi:hypothetical protein MJO28_016626 [Puccinia striiformis f. sp. tritici]|uniref:Uncharacterized protein n=1 Tax=Puccinia striiformis f. sp. tritici TaxID=168172 RepID=A0ACC0DNS0_9BASI|nr:hypothetical protein MJO28_016626 [Puccinia striiformis f. sp. tritici]
MTCPNPNPYGIFSPSPLKPDPRTDGSWVGSTDSAIAMKSSDPQYETHDCSYVWFGKLAQKKGVISIHRSLL